MTAWEAGLQAYEGWEYAAALNLKEVLPLAERGLAVAQLSLGAMYRQGQGVPQEDTEAVKSYRRAAQQGDADAQNMLGLMYAEGQGLPQDYIQSYMWFDLAGAQGSEKARQTQDFVAGKMTPEQIAEARKLARARESPSAQLEKAPAIGANEDMPGTGGTDGEVV